MTWPELITGIYEARRQRAGIAWKPRFYPAAAPGDITGAEGRLNAAFPASIRSLLLETNSVMDLMAVDGGEWFDCSWLVWTVEEIVEQNLYGRAATGERRYDHDLRRLVFFAGAGADGILFGFPVLDDGVCASRVVVWHPVGEELHEVSPSVEHFLRGWFTGALAV